MTREDDVHAILDVMEEWEEDNDVVIENAQAFDLAERLCPLMEQARGFRDVWKKTAKKWRSRALYARHEVERAQGHARGMRASIASEVHAILNDAGYQHQDHDWIWRLKRVIELQDDQLAQIERLTKQIARDEE